MSLYDYKMSLELAKDDPSFYTLIMAAMRGADTDNEVLLRSCWPEVWDDLQARYHAPGGLLEGEQIKEEVENDGDEDVGE